MAAFNKFNCFVADVGDGKHILSSQQMKVMLTNSAPSASNTVYTDITEITQQGGYNTGGAIAATTSWAQSGGIGKLVLGDPPTWTAVGTTIGPFRYAVLYNNTSATKPLVGWWDYTSNVTLQIGETFTVDLDQTNGVFTLS